VRLSFAAFGFVFSVVRLLLSLPERRSCCVPWYWLTRSSCTHAGTLVQIKRTLRPDGVFIGSMLGGDTLFELRSVPSFPSLLRELPRSWADPVDLRAQNIATAC